MKNNKGVTIASLTVYIIVLVIILAAMTFISVNYTSQISEITAKGKISNECTKFYAYLVKDIKSADTVVEYSDDFLRLDNDAKYSIRYKYINENENQRRQYEIYRNGAKISENILDASFNFDNELNVLNVNVKYLYGKQMIEKTQSFKVGRGY